MSSFNAVLEIGTSNTVLAIGESQPDGRVKVISHCRIPSMGVRKSMIIDIDQVRKSINSVLRESEKQQLSAGNKITLGNAFHLFSGTHVKTRRQYGIASPSRRKVTDADIEEARRTINTSNLGNKRELVDFFEQDFELDGMGGISDPRGMSGENLKLNVLLLDADSDRLNDARNAADAEKLELRDSLFAVTCAADAVLEERERHDGVLVLDCGGGTTGYAAYLDGRLVTTGSIGVGGDHVTNDIAMAFQTTQPQAETIKTTEASALPYIPQGVPPRVKMPGDSPLVENRTISRKALNTVVNARLRELLTMIRDELEAHDLIHRLHAGTVLVGGGAKMKDLGALATQILGTVTRTGKPIHVDWNEEVPDSERLAGIAGALMYAQRNYDEKSLLDYFKGWFK